MAPLVTVESSHAAERLRGIRNRGEGSGLTATFTTQVPDSPLRKANVLPNSETKTWRGREPSVADWVPRRAPFGAPFDISTVLAISAS